MVTLDTWKGKQVLDIGCGSSFFYAEASAFGIHVDPVDVVIKRDALNDLVAVYAKNTLFLQTLMFMQRGVQELAAPDFLVLDTIANKFDSIIEYYTKHGVLFGNVFKLSESFKIPYDVTICSYLFCYFGEEEKRDALVQILAVTKVGRGKNSYGCERHYVRQ